MRMNFLVVCVLALATAGCSDVGGAGGRPRVSMENLPAFPGAEGFGATTPGGRGGRVIEVTTLDDSGPGSLREACETKGPRIVVFRVAGTIRLKKQLRINEPFITIAGQTAPGEGICLAGEQLAIHTHDAVIRFIRVRPGDVSGRSIDAVSGRDCDMVVLDHVSASWSVDECISFTNPQSEGRVTVQYCLAAESLSKSVHYKGSHGFGGIWAATWGTYHHNLLAHHTSRNPRFGGCRITDHRNNVIYNWGYNSAYGGEAGCFNLVNNYYKAGPATRESVRSRIVGPGSRPDGTTGRWYVAGNYVEGFPEITADNWKGGVQPAGVPLEAFRSEAEFAAPHVRTESAAEAFQTVLRTAGCVLPKRDALDARIIEEVRLGTASHGSTYGGGGKGIIDSQNDVGGWLELAPGSAPPDTDHDGMPDDWEKKHGFDPVNPSDGAADADGDGYTNLEECLNGTDPRQFIDYTKPENNVDVLVK